MARKSKAKFTMKGHTLPGVNQRSETPHIKDGRSPSSAFQMKETGSSPNKIVGALGVAGLAAKGIGSLINKRKEGAEATELLEGTGKTIEPAEGFKVVEGGEGDDAPDMEEATPMEEPAPLTMKSPYKNYKNPQDYKVFNMGNEPTPVKKLRTGSSATVGGKLGGSSYKTESPFNQVPLQPGESDAIEPATEKDGKQEIINDLEDRIEFIREDIWNQQEGPADAEADESQATEEQAAALEVLRAELGRLRGETPPERDIPEGEVPTM